MPTLVVFLRALALLALAAPAVILLTGRRGPARPSHSMRAAATPPVVANFIAAALFFAVLLLWHGDAHSPLALPMALTGCVLAVAGAALVTASRRALGSAWSLVARTDAAVGLVTSGPYRFVRHPIYLGLLLLGTGQAVAFASVPAAVIAALGLLPTFVWRAVTEERLLASEFGDRFVEYRARTRLMIPGVV